VDIADASGYRGHADQMFEPRTEEEVSGILTRAAAQNIPVTVMGAMTGIVGGAAPQGGWGLSLARFRRLDIFPSQARVGAGVLLRDLQAAATAAKQFYAPDPTENTSSIGGNIAANASGSRSFRYGATRDHVLALRVVWMDGRVEEYRRGQPVDFDVPAIPLPRTTKHSAGYRLAPGMDFVELLTGSEGTLGVITEAELRLLPAPGEVTGGVFFFPSEEAALDAVDRWRPTPGLRMLEFLDGASLQLMDVSHAAALMIEIENETEGEPDLDLVFNLKDALESESWFATSAADRERFRQFRHALPERVNSRLRQSGFVKLGTDYAVPLDQNRAMLKIYRAVLGLEFAGQHVIFGHIGDAHLHVNILPTSQAQYQRALGVTTDLAREAVRLGGTVGAEHGLGKRKVHLLEIQYPPDVIAAMRAVKRRLDPQWLLGPGTLLAPS
jgi:FAD/FMN-containing dehydrogenase